MFKAIDENGNIVTFAEAKNKVKYYCRCCHNPVYYVKGNPKCKYGKSSHFRHYRNCWCSDTWHHDKTQWHRDWQNCFPVENQEVILENEGKRHIADVLIQETKTVFEFQHSYISPEEFNDRNAFYNSAGFMVIWVFDVQKSFFNHRIGKNDQGYNATLKAYYWENPIECLRQCRLNDLVDIFLQISGEDADVATEENKTNILRISRSDDGFSLFYAPVVFSKPQFLFFSKHPKDLSKYRLFYNKEEVDRFGDDRHIGMDSIGRRTVLGCPLVSSGKDILIEKCKNCHYYAGKKKGFVHCLKHYLDLSVAEASYVNKFYRNVLGQTERIEFSAIPSEKEVAVNEPIGNSIKGIWDEYNAAGIIIILNLHTGSTIKVCRLWYEEGKDKENYMCKIEMKGHQHYMREMRPLLYPEKNQFKVLWWKEPSR